MEAAGVDWDPLAGYLTRWRAEIPGLPRETVVRYCIGGWFDGGDTSASPDLWAHDGQGMWFKVPGDGAITTFAYRVEPAAPPLPEWVRDSVIYQIFLDRFHPGTPNGRWQHDGDPRGLHGGTLRGVLQALPYLDDLGVTCLWLSPLCASPSYHRYDTTDFYAIDPALGSADDLRALVRDAHQRGMRVLLDFVPAHCSWHHPAFRRAQESEEAPTASWFTFERRPDRYRMFLGMVSSLPSINTQDPGARAHLVDNAVFWLTQFDVDGFRVDHAIGASMDFYVALRRAMRAAKPDSFTVGEATDTPDSLRRYRNRLDAILDFPLADAFRLTFGRGDWSVATFDTFLTAYERYMDTGPGRLSFLDNHDMNRFLFVAGNQVERLKLAALCQFTLPPPPIVYYGSEVGMSQELAIEAVDMGGDTEVRRDMQWDESRWNQELRDFYRGLIALRTRHHVLRDGVRRTIHVDGERNRYAYLRSRGDEIGPGDILVALNLGVEWWSVSLSDGSAGWRTIVSTANEVPEDQNHVALPPLSAVALLAE
jgi:glycosidase